MWFTSSVDGEAENERAGYVQDMGSQLAFYRSVLGLEVKEPSGAKDLSEMHWVDPETGVCSLALHGGSQYRSGPDAPKMVFGVSDSEAARARLLASGAPMGAIRSRTPGILVSDENDPAGNTLSIESRSIQSDP